MTHSAVHVKFSSAILNGDGHFGCRMVDEHVEELRSVYCDDFNGDFASLRAVITTSKVDQDQLLKKDVFTGKVIKGKVYC